MHYLVYTINGKSHYDTQKFLCFFKCNTTIFFAYCTLKKETNNIENKSPLLLLILQLTRLRTFYENPFLYLEISS